MVQTHSKTEDSDTHCKKSSQHISHENGHKVETSKTLNMTEMCTHDLFHELS